MSVFIASDLHIQDSDDPLYASLLHLLRVKAQPGDYVVLAGDIFDLFIGNKKFYRQRYHEFVDAATACGQKGIQVHYIEGNHDFLMKHVFRQTPGVTVHPHSVSVEVEGKKFFIAHGDTRIARTIPTDVCAFFCGAHYSKAQCVFFRASGSTKSES